MFASAVVLGAQEDSDEEEEQQDGPTGAAMAMGAEGAAANIGRPACLDGLQGAKDKQVWKMTALGLARAGVYTCELFRDSSYFPARILSAFVDLVISVAPQKKSLFFFQPTESVINRRIFRGLFPSRSVRQKSSQRKSLCR